MKVLERVWMLAKANSVIYCVGSSAKDVWQQVIEQEFMGTGVTREMLRQQGYRAKKIALCEEEE